MNKVSFSQQIQKILLNMSKINKIKVMNRNKLNKNMLIKNGIWKQKKNLLRIIYKRSYYLYLCFKFKFQSFTLF